MNKLVTLGGECFEAEFEGKQVAPDRDGVFYLFRLKDLTKNRGELLVSLFRFGPDKLLVPNYDACIQAVRLNAIRRGFDAGTLSFDRPPAPHQYQQLSLTPADFRPQPAASEEGIRQFIVHKAYWLSYRYSSEEDRFPIQFDEPVDLAYLGVESNDVRRNVWLLGQQGLLEKTDIPGLGRPTPQLIEEYEPKWIRRTPMAAGATVKQGDISRTVFIVHGHDEGVKQSVARFLEKLDLHALVLHEQPSKGRTIIEKFEAHSDVGFAVVLLTPDDLGSMASAPDKLQPRARQNVILELGYFIGKLGRARVCALYTKGVELPSDIHDVVYVPYDEGGAWRIGLARELNAAGIVVDMNRIA